MHFLVDEIKAHFPVQPVPNASDAIVNAYMVEHLYEILGDRPWPELSATECRYCSDGFNLLTPVGLHYYLPAYMTAEIVDSEEADVVVDALIGLFQGVWFYGPGKIFSFWELLTPSQLVVIGQWIDHYESKYYFNDCSTAEVQNARALVALFVNA